MKMIEVKCDMCETMFSKPLKEHKRSLENNKKEFCSRNCAGRHIVSNFGDKVNKDTSYLKNYSKRDKFTGFRKFIRSINVRVNESNKTKGISLEELKQVWDEQKGICPLTGWSMVLKEGKGCLPNQASIDRIDNTKGYISGNVRFVALIANYCRNNFSDDQVIDFCRSVVNNISHQ